MDHKSEDSSKPQQWVGILVILATMLCASAIPGYTWGGHGWGGVGVTLGIGLYWWPYGYSYAYPYTYPTQVYVPPAPQVSIQPPSSSPVWYYCDSSQGYYPYVHQCPGGWRTVPASPP